MALLYGRTGHLTAQKRRSPARPRAVEEWQQRQVAVVVESLLRLVRLLGGPDSHGAWSHLGAPYFISLVVIRTKYTRARLNDSTARG